MPCVQIPPAKIRKFLVRVCGFACGLIGLVLLRWTPATWQDGAVYALLVIVLGVAMVIFAPREERYWPDPPENSTSKKPSA